MSNAEKLNEARQKIKGLRENLRMRALSRETPLLDLLSSKMNGSFGHAEKEQNAEVFEALSALKKQNEDLDRRNRELLAELEQQKRERFSARVG